MGVLLTDTCSCFSDFFVWVCHNWSQYFKFVGFMASLDVHSLWSQEKAWKPFELSSSSQVIFSKIPLRNLNFAPDSGLYLFPCRIFTYRVLCLLCVCVWPSWIDCFLMSFYPCKRHTKIGIVNSPLWLRAAKKLLGFNFNIILNQCFLPCSLKYQMSRWNLLTRRGGNAIFVVNPLSVVVSSSPRLYQSGFTVVYRFTIYTLGQ